MRKYKLISVIIYEPLKPVASFLMPDCIAEYRGEQKLVDGKKDEFQSKKSLQR